MTNITTMYLGLSLKNPLIAGASSYTGNIDTLKKLQEAGVGAVVLKSLFEEQIQLERFEFDEDRDGVDAVGQEMSTPVFPKTLEHGGAQGHLAWVREVRKSLSIPVIASINAVSRETWIEYAQKLETTGVDALELNMYTVPQGSDLDSANIEQEQVDAAAAVVQSVKIPVSVKLTPYYANPLNIIDRLDKAGIRGIVVFNKLMQPAVDPDSEQLRSPSMISSSLDLRLPLRYTGMLFGEIGADICTSTGIMGGKDAAAALLTGASAFQVVSALYKNKIDHVRVILDGLQRWMESKGYQSIQDFKGKTSRKKYDDQWAYRRAQYINALFRANSIMDSSKIS